MTKFDLHIDFFCGFRHNETMKQEAFAILEELGRYTDKELFLSAAMNCVMTRRHSGLTSNPSAGNP
jgi:hypothetical protein